MKYLMTLLFYAFLTNGFSQVWIDNDAKWTFDYFNVAETGTWRWTYTHDTTIQGHQTQVIRATKYRYGGPFPSIIDYGNTYTYSSNDSVFYFKDGKFFLLYDFGASIGDTWVISIDTIETSCQDTAIVQVIDTGSIIINSQEFRTITLETISASFYALNGLCVEKFGILPTSYANNNFGFKPGYQYCPGGPIIDYDLLTFRCYTDSSFPTYNPTGKDCDTLTSTQEIIIKNIEIFPNPSHNILHIEYPANSISNIEILDINGRLIGKHHYVDKIDISKLKNGIYMIKIQTVDNLETIRTFIKQ